MSAIIPRVFYKIASNVFMTDIPLLLIMDSWKRIDITKEYPEHNYVDNTITYDCVIVRNILPWWKRWLGYTKFETFVAKQNKRGQWIEYWPYSVHDTENVDIQEHFRLIGAEVIEKAVIFSKNIEKNACVYR